MNKVNFIQSTVEFVATGIIMTATAVTAKVGSTFYAISTLPTVAQFGTECLSTLIKSKALIGGTVAVALITDKLAELLIDKVLEKHQENKKLVAAGYLLKKVITVAAVIGFTVLMGASPVVAIATLALLVARDILKAAFENCCKKAEQQVNNNIGGEDVVNENEGNEEVGNEGGEDVVNENEGNEEVGNEGNEEEQIVFSYTLEEEDKNNVLLLQNNLHEQEKSLLKLKNKVFISNIDYKKLPKYTETIEKIAKIMNDLEYIDPEASCFYSEIEKLAIENSSDSEYAIIIEDIGKKQNALNEEINIDDIQDLVDALKPEPQPQDNNGIQQPPKNDGNQHQIPDYELLMQNLPPPINQEPPLQQNNGIQQPQPQQIIPVFNLGGDMNVNQFAGALGIQPQQNNVPQNLQNLRNQLN